MTDCPTCGHTLDTEENNDALADDPEHDYFCPSCGDLFGEGDLETPTEPFEEGIYYRRNPRDAVPLLVEGMDVGDTGMLEQTVAMMQGGGDPNLAFDYAEAFGEPGVYLLAPGGEVVALHTESGGGDLLVLAEYLRENGLADALEEHLDAMEELADG